MGKPPKDHGYPHKRPDGRFEQWLRFGRDPRTGKPIRKKVTGATRDEVRKKVRALRAKHEAGADVRKKPGTVGDLARHYLSVIDVRPRTLATYRYIIERFILPHLGDKPATIGPKDLNTFFATIRKLPRKKHGNQRAVNGEPIPIAASTISLVRTILSQIFALAVEENTLTANPVNRTRAIRVEKSPRRALTDDEAAALLEALRGDRLEVAIRLLLSLGLRRGESAALQLDDLDLEAGTLRVDATSGYVRGVGQHYGPPKTETSERVLRIPPPLLPAIRWHLRQRELEQKAMGWPDSPWLFRSVRTGGRVPSGTIYDAFCNAARRAGLVGHTPHSLRHSCASFLAAEGTPPHVIKEILGHASMAELDRYVHTLPGQQEAALTRVAERLELKQRASGE